MHRRLAEFIRSEMEPILQDWEQFAKTILQSRYMGSIELRDHAREMLLAISDDLDTHQSQSEQARKSKGRAPDDGVRSWAEVHGGDRQTRASASMRPFRSFAPFARAWCHTGQKLTRRFPARTSKTSPGFMKR